MSGAEVTIAEVSSTVSVKKPVASDVTTAPDICLEFDLPADANYDAFGELLRERLAQVNKRACIRTTVDFH
jgi:hypothetical protein